MFQSFWILSWVFFFLHILENWSNLKALIFFKILFLSYHKFSVVDDRQNRQARQKCSGLRIHHQNSQTDHSSYSIWIFKYSTEFLKRIELSYFIYSFLFFTFFFPCFFFFFFSSFLFVFSVIFLYYLLFSLSVYT